MTTEPGDTNVKSGVPHHTPPAVASDKTCAGFLAITAGEGLKGLAKKVIFKFIGFLAYWQEQVNAELLQEIKALRQRVDLLERSLREVSGKQGVRPDQIPARVDSQESDYLVPPKEKIFDGSLDNYRQIGEYYLGQFVSLAQLNRDETVLDVGCGIGRMAVPLANYMSSKGTYEGFDIVPDGIAWCQENISSRYPNFHFQLADVFNKFYNPSGTYRAREYRFPFENGYFDFVFLTSVFTHMLPRDMEHYLHEISRVMRKGGRCFITFFLMDSEHMRHVRENTAGQSFDFKHELDDDGAQCLVVDMSFPENAVGYHEDYVRRLFEGAHLRIAEPVLYGFQDIVIAYKE